VRYLDYQFYLTRSMIFHKQISLLGLDRIFIFSPNIRLEPPDYAKTGRHLLEFTQLDIEMKDAGREEVMALAEDMYCHILSRVRDHCVEELKGLKRILHIPSRPFGIMKYLDAYREYGPGFEMEISKRAQEPFWIIDIPIEAREFYDREYEEQPGILCDMDMIYPEGFGEALSGGEREYEYERILNRVRQYEIDPGDFSWYLGLAKRGLPRCAGFGIGVERLTRYICGLGHVAESTLFPKIPGVYAI
jgi:asparaginyl-tRNA synthetase